MATIPFLSIQYLPASAFTPNTIKVGISHLNAISIQSDPNSLNIVWEEYNGTPNYVMNVNNGLYPDYILPPFGNAWKLVYESGSWFIYLSFNASTNDLFKNYLRWDSFNMPVFYTGSTQSNTIQLVSEPPYFMPVYNPIVFKIYSEKYDKTGYRYLVNIFNVNGDNIAKLKLVPLPNGNGEVDIQKILSNYLSYDFKQTDTDEYCLNSFMGYNVVFGEEYLSEWNYTNLSSYSAATIWSGYTVLNQTNSGLTHNYQTGNQVNVSTITTGSTQSINGLHTIVDVPSNTSIVIDVPYTGTSSINISGSTTFSDFRKTGFNDLTDGNGYVVYNGVFNWNDWKNYDYTDYYLDYPSSQKLLLTSINSYSNQTVSQYVVPNNEKFLMNKTQEFYFNFGCDSELEYYLVLINNFGSRVDILIANEDNTAKVKQFKINYDILFREFGVNVTSFSLALRHSSDIQPITKWYNFYIDERCQIENTEIYFTDKLGSILSIPFSLRQNESIDVEREVFNQQKSFSDRVNLSLTEGGETIHNISSKKTYTLNGNWMNDSQMLLFEIMMESPYTWVKLDGIMYNCIIEDKNTEIQKYKNKSIFKKTIKIHLSSQNALNI
jgi:hypothetical protein